MGNHKFAFEDLNVWKKAIAYADVAMSMADNLESDRRHYRLLEQFDAACTSVAMNIAEGKGRRSKKEFIHFLYIARGSLYESITLAKIFGKRGWVSAEDLQILETHALEVASMIKGLINSIYKSI
jgi:four helix bundle protein